MELSIDDLWAELLSRDPARIVRVWKLLTEEERISVHQHLMRMATEPDWTEPQRISARRALDSIASATT